MCMHLCVWVCIKLQVTEITGTLFCTFLDLQEIFHHSSTEDKVNIHFTDDELHALTEYASVVTDLLEIS